MPSSNPYTTRFAADITIFEREIARMQALNTRQANKIAADQARAAKMAANAWSNSNIAASMNKQFSGMGAQLGQYTKMIAGLFAGKEALAAADQWKQFTNSLKVAGQEGQSLKSTQNALYDIAIKNGTELGPLGQLYSRLSQSQKELGATAPQLIQFTNGVASALKVAGTSSGEATGALLQLSQMMGSSVVHAEEFNSVNEGARPILQAVANGIAKYHGSIAALRADVIKGKVTNTEFFNGFLNGSAALEAQAAKSATTVGQAMTNIRTALTKYIGETDASYGATDRLTAGLNLFAQNIDKVAKSVEIVGALYAATFIPTVARASAAIVGNTAVMLTNGITALRTEASMIALSASLGGVTVAETATGAAAFYMGTALKGAMAFLGGPVGVAITAITVALGYFAVTSIKAATDTEALSRAIEAQKQSFAEHKKAADAAAVAEGVVDKSRMAGIISTAKLTGEQDKLKDAYYRVAAAAKEASLQTKEKQLAETENLYKGAKRDAATKYVDIKNGYQNQTYSTGPGSVSVYSGDQVKKLAKGDFQKTYEAAKLRDAAQNRRDAQAEVIAEKGKKLDDFAGIATPVASPTKTKKVHDNTSRSEDAEAKAQKALNDATNSLATTIDQRHQVQLAAIEEDRAEAIRNVQQDIRDGKITKAKGDAAIALYNQTADVKKGGENAAYQRDLEDQANELQSAKISLSSEGLRAQADELNVMADNARYLVDKQAYERKALVLKQQADDAEFKQQQDQLALDRQRAGMTLDVIKSLREAAENNRNKVKLNETTGLEQSQGRDTRDNGGKSVGATIKDTAEGFGSLNQQLGNIATGGIDTLSKGLTDAVMGAKSLQAAFSDMAKSVISQLIEMAIRFAIFEAIGAALGMPGLGKASIGLGKTPAHAAGTNFAPGGLSLVGEKGPELMMTPKGSQIANSNLLMHALNGSAKQSSGGSTVNIHTTVNANDSVLTDTVKGWVSSGVAAAVQQSNVSVRKDLSKQQNNRLGR